MPTKQFWGILGFFWFIFLFSSASINHVWAQLSSSKINSCNYTSNFRCSVLEEQSAENDYTGWEVTNFLEN